EYLDKSYVDMDDHFRVAWVFRDMAGDAPRLAVILRYEGSLNRAYYRAFKHLRELQSARNKKLPNQPNSGSGGPSPDAGSHGIGGLPIEDNHHIHSPPSGKRSGERPDVDHVLPLVRADRREPLHGNRDTSHHRGRLLGGAKPSAVELQKNLVGLRPQID